MDHRSDRREFLRLAAGAAAGGVLIAAVPAPAVPAATLEAMRHVTGSAQVQPGKVSLALPPLSENGNSVPLEVRVVVCAGEAYWREDVRFVLEQEFSTSWTSDGRRGFFHPDEWTFGQSLHRSAIEGRNHRVTGVKHVVRITMKRFSSRVPATPGTEVLDMGFDEVLLLANDPSHLERGLIRFTVQGGRR